MSPVVDTSETPYLELGRAIRRGRIAKTLEQAAAAELLDVSPRALREWEAGRARPALSRLVAVADALDLDVAVLIELGGYDDDGRPS